MPRRREGPRRDPITGYFYFDESLGFGESKHRVRFSLRTQNPEKAHFLWEREFRRQWDIYYGIVKPAAFSPPISFSAAAELYVEYARTIKRITEWKTAEERLDIIGDIIGNIELQAFGSEEIKTIDRELQARDRSKATVNHYFGLLKAFFNWAIRSGKFHGTNPVREVRAYVVDQRRREYSPDELKRIVEAAGRIEAEARRGAVVQRSIQKIVLLLLYTGMRLGQLLALRWENVRGDQLVIPATATKQRREQVIPISQSARQILDSMRDARRKDGYVLPLQRLGRKKPAWCYDAMKKIQKISGVADFTFHGLRHTAATIMVTQTLGRGVGLADIMRVLGHSKVETTIRYLHGDKDRMRKAVEALEKIVAK